MSELRTCETHGCFEGDSCPVCETRGRRLLTASQRRQASKFLSGALRHFPDDAGLTLDTAGWAAWETVVERTLERYEWLTPAGLKAIVQLDPKGRFEIDDGRIRAGYGHSVDVALESASTPVPETLYHGTSPAAYEAIRSEGLNPMSRNQVHLSGDIETAREVGRRHAADPVVLAVDTAALGGAGGEITKRGRSVYTTDHVPPAALQRVE